MLLESGSGCEQAVHLADLGQDVERLLRDRFAAGGPREGAGLLVALALEYGARRRGEDRAPARTEHATGCDVACSRPLPRRWKADRYVDAGGDQTARCQSVRHCLETVDHSDVNGGSA